MQLENHRDRNQAKQMCCYCCLFSFLILGTNFTSINAPNHQEETGSETNFFSRKFATSIKFTLERYSY